MADDKTARPSHHGADGKFQNPWESYTHVFPSQYLLKVLPNWRKQVLRALPIVTPSFLTSSASTAASPAVTSPLEATWIGHATFVVQMHGWNVITDPIFSHRCSPVSFAGPARYTPVPCEVEDLPQIHLVCISHNHYDHLDADTVKRLLKNEKKHEAACVAAGTPFHPTRWACGLRVSPILTSLGVAADRIVELDWWQKADLAASNARHGSLSVIGVPAQHHSQRGLFDRYHALWCGFVVTSDAPATSASTSAASSSTVAGAGAALEPPTPAAPEKRSFYFSGDTGYRSVAEGVEPDSPEEKAAPVCPAFREIGARYGPIDLGLIPIGAYSPRWFMCGQHVSPEDAVDIHNDVRARTSIGMHWGTFPMTDEPIEEPPRRLASALVTRSMPANAFITVKHGETWKMPLA